MTNSNNTKIARPVGISPLADVVLEIIIPFKENYKSLQDLLLSLQEIKNVKFSVTLVDDHSKNLDFTRNLKDVHGLKIIRLDEDKGFGYAINEAVKQSKNEYFMVMHSDVYGLDLNTVRTLFKSLLDAEKDNVAVVSAMIDNPLPNDCAFLKADGPIAGTHVICDDNQFIPFICSAFHKGPFSKAGGFPPYPYCLFEDRLLCKKLKLFGYKLAYCPAAFCRHYGGATVKKLIGKNPEILKIIKNNNQLFKNDSGILDEHLKKISH